eukprot:TRINITY_DN32052_c0_g3_i5.p2 TRINITY_DN32052_c0_g3~~TRINITY_DN32052_c0_g3_i5.p2  ORF type:complete len:225 (+),score=-10.56 TRINITY_DN32052_c0_g3_i5:465-1139(+)
MRMGWGFLFCYWQHVISQRNYYYFCLIQLNNRKNQNYCGVPSQRSPLQKILVIMYRVSGPLFLQNTSVCYNKFFSMVPQVWLFNTFCSKRTIWIKENIYSIITWISLPKCGKVIVCTQFQGLTTKCAQNIDLAMADLPKYYASGLLVYSYFISIVNVLFAIFVCITIENTNINHLRFGVATIQNQQLFHRKMYLWYVPDIEWIYLLYIDVEHIENNQSVQQMAF